MEVLQQWITGRGKQPVTWTTLTQCLRDIELTVLAGEIEAIKCHTNWPEKDCFSRRNSAQNPLTDGPTSFGSRSTGESCIRDHKNYEPLQQVTDIACGFVQQMKENNQKNSAPHGVSEDPSVQRSIRESTAEGTKSQHAEVLAMYMQKCLASMLTKGSHSSSTGESDNQIDGNYEAFRSVSHGSPPVQRHLQESTAEVPKSQNAEAFAMFVQEMQKYLGQTIIGASHPSNVGESSIGYDEPAQQMADIACRFVQQLKEKENQHSSAPNGVSEDQRSLRESTAEDTKSQIADALAIYMQQVQKSLGSIFTKGSHSTSNGKSDNQIDGNYEAI